MSSIIVMKKSWDAMSCQWVYELRDEPLSVTDDTQGRTASINDTIEALFVPMTEAVSIFIFSVGLISLLLVALS